MVVAQGYNDTLSKVDIGNSGDMMANPIPVLTEDEKMNARLVVAGYLAPEDGLAEMLDILGINKEKVHD